VNSSHVTVVRGVRGEHATAVLALTYNDDDDDNNNKYDVIHRVSEKKTSTHIIGYKLGNSCLILIIFDIKIPHIILHRKTA